MAMSNDWVHSINERNSFLELEGSLWSLSHTFVLNKVLYFGLWVLVSYSVSSSLVIICPFKCQIEENNRMSWRILNWTLDSNRNILQLLDSHWHWSFRNALGNHVNVSESVQLCSVCIWWTSTDLRYKRIQNPWSPDFLIKFKISAASLEGSCCYTRWAYFNGLQTHFTHIFFLYNGLDPSHSLWFKLSLSCC